MMVVHHLTSYSAIMSRLQVICFCVCFTKLMEAGAVAKVEDEPVSNVYAVEAVQGGIAKLPCDLDFPNDDKVTIVIWFKYIEHRKAPIYSFDAREKLITDPSHWSDKGVVGDRAHFYYEDKPAKLKLENVRDSDGGLYECRVDFRQTPTRIIKVNLTVIIPPEKLSILDETGHHIPDYVLGPYNEGSSINITCVATGGRPPPKVTWWQENALLDDSFDYLSDRRVRNILHLDKLERKHLHTVFICQASNNNLVAPISSSVTLEINLRPLFVRLLEKNKPLSAEITYNISCEVVGSRPEPTITWWKGSTQMKNTREVTSHDGNTTTSILSFCPTVEDGGKYLSCRGQQPDIQDSGIEDGWKLDIHHVPLVSLELGSTLNNSTIKEGVDVYFECNIKSNPWVFKVSWRHNGKPLFNNVQQNTIVSNQSLVLQSITRARSGHYTCVGHNKEGDGESNPVQLDVKYIPSCLPGQPRVFGVARNELARIVCELEANPTDVQFVWKFNNSADTMDIPESQIQVEKTRSIVSYKPITELDYGTLLCWGRNEIGMQKEPCVFYINPAGRPDALSNCTILNQTSESLHVECIEGFDGGLQQEFIMEVYDTQTRKLVSNVTSRNPIFTVGGLESGLYFDVGLYAANKKGRSGVAHLNTHTLKSAEKHTDRPKPHQPENCTISIHTKYYLQVKCMVPTALRHSSDIYLLQVYDANTRLLIGTATSQNPEEIMISSLPVEHEDLLLFVRTMNAKSVTSEANIIYAPRIMLLKTGASTPVLLQITPLLGALIGVVAALILVAIIIVVVIRLRESGDRDDKDYDDGGLASSRRCAGGGNSDKASTEPLNKDLNDSVDSLEEKNPDIIPQNNADDEYQDEERAFERLNNAPSLRVYSRMQSPTLQTKNGGYNDEITYAELSLTNQQMQPHMIYNQKAIPMTVIRRQEPTVYAQLQDMKRLPPQCLQPLSPPHPSSFQTLHHPHLPAYMPRPLREDPQYMNTDSSGGNSISAETPLISSSRDNNAIQSLIEVSSSTRTPTITSTLPRSINATRF